MSRSRPPRPERLTASLRDGLAPTLAPAPARKGFCAYEETGEDQDLRTAFAER